MTRRPISAVVAIAFNTYGGTDVLELVDTEPPVPGSSQDTYAARWSSRRSGAGTFDFAGIERETSRHVRPPGAALSPVVMECRSHTTLRMGNSTWSSDVPGWVGGVRSDGS
ncbi:hypothetical protein AB0H88_03500 [Nonomuraea sp. NPDC050680]|uniref:hypothetical protein n=1 Tax=Nonomuraea sp. NPDC050680 TaxID=3154630 RepID=UPI0033FC7906